MVGGRNLPLGWGERGGMVVVVVGGREELKNGRE